MSVFWAVLGFTCFFFVPPQIALQYGRASDSIQWAPFGTSLSRQRVLGSALAFTCAALTLSCSRTSTLDCDAFERNVVIAVGMSAALCQYGFILPSERILRERMMVFLIMLWLPLSQLFYFRMSRCWMVSAWIFINQELAIFLKQYMLNDDLAVPLRGHIALLAAHAIYLQIARRQHQGMKEMYDVQQQNQSEKEASQRTCKELAAQKLASETLLVELKQQKQALESLLSMVCDSSFWLSKNGERIVCSEKRFDAMLGRNMLQERLLDHIPDKEHNRLVNALRAESAGPGADSPVRLLPTAFQLREGVLVNVDLFIIDRRQDGTESGYLVGVRLAPSAETAISSETATLEAATADATGATTFRPQTTSRRLPAEPSVASSSSYFFLLEERNTFINAKRRGARIGARRTRSLPPPSVHFDEGSENFNNPDFDGLATTSLEASGGLAESIGTNTRGSDIDTKSGWKHSPEQALYEQVTAHCARFLSPSVHDDEDSEDVNNTDFDRLAMTSFAIPEASGGLAESTNINTLSHCSEMEQARVSQQSRSGLEAYHAGDGLGWHRHERAPTRIFQVMCPSNRQGIQLP